MINRRSLLAAAPALSLAAGLGAMPRPSLAADAQDHIDLRKLLADQGVPGLGVAVVSSKGVSQIAVAGSRRADRKDPIKTDDAWLIADNTMGLTAAVFGRLVEQGKTSWDAKVPDLFPGARIDPAWNDVTAAALLSHRSGVDDRLVISTDWVLERHADERPARLQRRDLAVQMLNEAPALNPGPFLLARANYLLIGAAMERLTDTDFPAILHDEAFDWWNALSAGVGAPVGAAPLGHKKDDKGVFQPLEPGEFADYPAVMQPATGVHISLGDYGRFIQLMLANGGGWLKPETLARIGRPYDSKVSTYALGWRLTPDVAWAGGPVLGHDGSNGLWRSKVLIAPEKDLGLIAVCNADDEEACQRTIELALKVLSPDKPPTFNELNLG